MHFDEVIGHGMNAAELAANPRLSRSFVQDLNRRPELPLETASCDAGLCCVGVQYLQRPVTVFADVRRVLRPGVDSRRGNVNTDFLSNFQCPFTG